MKILLVDDEKLQLVRLEKEVKKVLNNSEIISYTNPFDALKDKDVQYDIAFLDIEMPGINGIQLAKKLKNINKKINIIFVTAYDNYALDAYKIHASGYITKPVNEKKILEEIDVLRNPIELKNDNKLYIKCFGNFEVFYDNKPLKFTRSKSKELFAYLVDREGASVNINELNAILWDDDDHKSYCRNLIADIQNTLKDIGLEDIFVKRRNECFIDVSKVECDAYQYKNNNPEAINLYRGEYMSQYPWAFFDDKIEE